MVRYRGLDVPEAYIIEENNEREKQGHDLDGVLVPLAPAYEYNILPKTLEEKETEEYHSKVIVIDL